MPDSPARFAIGDTVQRINRPEEIGVVRERRWSEQSESWNYQVQFGQNRPMVPEAALQALVEVFSPWDALEKGSFSGAERFVFTLTYHRLRRPPSRIAYSFARSRTVFYPHQFKPLLKFLDNPGRRLLIADDVGLGKTIEAGYILEELDAQQSVERVLILVPARLVTKWKMELRDRFGKTFDAVKGSDVIALAQRIRQGHEPEPFRWILSYESARFDAVREAIEETEPPIDLLIADEAHRMRNPDTLQHRVGAALAQAADSVIFLSATPVQNKLEDLYHLLRLLSAEEFANWPLFSERIEANRSLIRAQAALARRPSGFDEAGRLLGVFLKSRGGQHAAATAAALQLEDRLGRGTDADRREIVELQADLGRLSPVGHIIARTRKAEAIPNRPVRHPAWQRVELTPAERSVYDSVQALCIMSRGATGDLWGFQMGVLMAYRMTASCIPAALTYFRGKLGTLGPQEGMVTDDPEAHGEGSLESWPAQARDGLAAMLNVYSSSLTKDSKLECLLGLLREIWAEDANSGRAPRKIVLFSYFILTLEYLTGALNGHGIQNRMIHGRIAVREREQAIDEFLESSDVRVLLSSEVGGEGIDLQRASVVINYDLPWNPMVVEQRIGRVDRIGQKAERIIVRNLVIRDSVEERVLQRLLEKIGVFVETIGEMDPILGDEIENIAARALRGELSGDELTRLVEEQGDILARRMREAREMLSRVDGLLAADQGLIDEIGSVTGERQVPAERDMLLFLNDFLARYFPGRQLPGELAWARVECDLAGPLARAMEGAAAELGPDVALFARRIATGPVALSFSREVGYSSPRTEVISVGHPLVRFALHQIATKEGRLAGAFALQLADSKILPPGRFAFAVALLDIRGQRPMTRLLAAFCRLGDGDVVKEPDVAIPIVIELLDRAESSDGLWAESEKIGLAQERLEGALDDLTREWDERERRHQTARREQHKATLRSTFEFKVERVRELLKGLEQRGAREFPIRMARKRLEKAERDLEGFRSLVVDDPPVAVEREDLAVGIVLVGAGV